MSDCIRYQVPLYEIERAASGVPMEELEKTKPPVIFNPPTKEESTFIKKRKNKPRDNKGRWVDG